MAVELFTEGLEPDDSDAPVWRFMDFGKFKDLMETRELYFRRSDKLSDEHEGLPPEEFTRLSLRLDRYDIGDNEKLNHDLGSTAQFRQAFYLNCWYLFNEETAGMWARYGKDGVAVVSRYSLLKAVLDPIPDRPHLGLVRYGWELGTRWNVQRFITTKRIEYAHEREVRAALWLLDTGDGVNRHFDSNNRPQRLPIHEPPPTMPFGIKRSIDLQVLVLEVVLNPAADDALSESVTSLVHAALGDDVKVRPSALASYSRWLPSVEELQRFGSI